MVIARSLLPVTLAAALAVSAPSSAWAQSDKTCIAYMEADDAFRQAKEQAPEYLEFLVAQKQFYEAHMQADEAMRKADRADSDLSKIKLLRVAISTKETALETLDHLIAVRDKLLAALGPASNRRADTHATAYKGPVSDNPRVMTKLILADVERCRDRLER